MKILFRERMRPRRGALAFVALTGALVTACAPTRVPSPSPAPVALSPLPEHRVHDAGTDAPVGFDAVVARAAEADVVVFGEQHFDPGTHALQLSLLEALAARGVDVVLSLEMIERDVQPVLDAYLAGEITEEEFLARSRPWSNYQTDYRPLVEFARLRGWPVVAANVPRPLASRVSREGLGVLDTLSPEERAVAAEEAICPRDAYYENFVEVMSQGGHDMMAMVDRFYEAQCIKDETMAESIVRALEAWPGAVVVHMTGAFHSDFRLGTVERIARRAPSADIVVLTAIPLPDLTTLPTAEHRARADFLLFTVQRE